MEYFYDIKSLTIIDPPDMPIGPLKVSDVTAKSAELSWKPPKDDGGKPIKRYVIEQRDLKRNNWYQVDTVRPNTHTLTLDRLNEGNDYMFRIIAENDEGRSQPLETTEVVTPRRAPGKMMPAFYVSHLLVDIYNVFVCLVRP
jgi:titin